jgi:hypothetical protein
MLLPILVLGDIVLRPQHDKPRWGAYLLLGAVFAGYLALRYAWLGPFEMPGRPYAYPVGSPGFVRFVVDKFFYSLLGLAAFVPIIGFSAMQYLQANPAWLYGGAALLIAAWSAAIKWLKPARVIVFWLLLATVPLLPVLPVFASSHHLYLACAGIVLAAVTLFQKAWQRASTRADTKHILARRGIAALLAMTLMTFVGLNALHGIGIAGFSAASQLPAREVVRFAGPLQPGDRLFFINLAPIGFNCMPAIEEARHVQPLDGYVLTFGSSLMRMNEPASVQRTGPRSIRVRHKDSGYFSGLIGRSMMEAIDRDRPFRPGERFSTPDFDVEVIRADAHGVYELRFTFRRPLDDPQYHFFYGSSIFSAYPLRWSTETNAAPPDTKAGPTASSQAET